MIVPSFFRRLCTAASWLAAGLCSSAMADTGPCATVLAGQTLPDLMVDVQALKGYLSVSDEKFSPGSCSIEEGFVSGPGWHSLLRFTSSTPNVGQGALVIGDPASCPALFELSSCHGHRHFQQYADYRLWTPGGYDTWRATRDLSSPTNTGSNAAYLAQATKSRQLVVGLKMGFCMIDSVRYHDTASTTPRFTSCTTNQGLSAGWADRYDARLDGQYLEIDGLKAGEYVLENHVNPEHLLPETNYANNSAAVRIRYTPKRGSTPAVIEAVEVLPP